VLTAPDLERVLVVTAHPDDVDFSSAGTIANLTDAGVVVTYCLVTDGQAGGFDTTIARPAMAAIRRDEQTKAAAEVGVTDVIFLGRMDGEVVFDHALRHDITRVIRQVRPQVVITHPPAINISSVYGSHADHVATGQATWAAVYPDARNPFAFPDLAAQGLAPWVVREVWYVGGPAPDHAVDITDQFAVKVAAVKAHATQTSHTDVDVWLRERAGAVARNAGLSAGRLAEAYTVLRTE
jgi:LmbE family N-acetylglucosaminyl deacetylase